MKRIREVVVVEGKYDTVRLKSAVDAMVIETAGFGIFKDKKQLELLRSLAEKRGLLILTDSDSAGFVIRNYLSGSIPAAQLKHAYIPEIAGKERRKETPSKEGLLGVEGIDNEVIIESLRRAGATFEDEEKKDTGCGFSKTDLYDLGLWGTADSSKKRKLLLQKLNLPDKISISRLLEVLNIAYEKGQILACLQEIEKEM